MASLRGTGKAAKSSSGASMSAYDVEVEARLKALEGMVNSLAAKVAELESHEHAETSAVAQVTNDSTADHEKLLAVETALNKVRGVLGV